jgi:hypothetical protein
MGVPGANPQHAAMESISPPPRALEHNPISELVAGTVVATLLIVTGVLLAIFAFATPLLTSFLPGGRPSTGQLVLGVAIWAIALVAPAGFVLLGTTRLARILSRARRAAPRQSPLMKAMGTLPEGATMASGLTLPDGRTVSDLVLGSFGAAVIRELPPAAVTRIREGNWELRTSRGWIPLENPLDRATRDAERVRRWFGGDDADFVVKVYAAVVSANPPVARTTGCAVLTPAEIGPWVAALPAQRSLTAGRIEHMVELARAAAI